jgi:hypothetical protein
MTLGPRGHKAHTLTLGCRDPYILALPSLTWGHAWRPEALLRSWTHEALTWLARHLLLLLRLLLQHALRGLHALLCKA